MEIWPRKGKGKGKDKDKDKKKDDKDKKKDDKDKKKDDKDKKKDDKDKKKDDKDKEKSGTPEKEQSKELDLCPQCGAKYDRSSDVLMLNPPPEIEEQMRAAMLARRAAEPAKGKGKEREVVQAMPESDGAEVIGLLPLKKSRGPGAKKKKKEQEEEEEDSIVCQLNQYKTS